MIDLKKMKLETRSIVEKAQVEKRELSADEQKLYTDNLEVIRFEERAAKEELEKRALETEKSNETKIVEIRNKESKKMETEKRNLETAEIGKELMEKRAISLGVNGDTGYSSKVFAIKGSLADIVDLVTIETGAKPNTKFGLFSPSMNNIARVTEGSTGATASTMAWAPVNVAPAPYLGYVNVTDYFLKQNPAGAMDKFADNFRAGLRNKIATEIIAGTGTGSMLGIFKNTGIASVSCAATGAPKLVDILALIASLTGKFKRSELAIVINPTFLPAIKAADTKLSYFDRVGDYAYIDGVKIIESDDALAVTTATNTVAAIGYFADYGVAIADDLEIEMLSKSAGSDNVPLQGIAYVDGSVIVPASFKRLVTI